DVAVRLADAHESHDEPERPVGWTAAHVEGRDVLIGMTLRSFQKHYGITDQSSQQLQDKFVELCNTMVDHGWSLLFLSTDYWQSEDRENDREVFEHVLKRMRSPDKVHVVDDILDPAELIRAYGRCDALISVRLHPIILASTTGVPSVAIAYDPKCREFMTQLDMDRFCLDVESFDAAEAFSLLRELIDDRAAISDRIQQRCTELQQATGEVYRRIHEIVTELGPQRHAKAMVPAPRQNELEATAHMFSGGK
ncbi:MAG: polysaccharide pyruvyl transferase family protein, partial [Planctomycetaceae bacterium]|nr:polysaccharide pyruvyl transferase family protein [Planctomycetaceae bacterium]